MDELSSWLAELGLDRYAPVFSANGVVRATLQLLSESELEALGVLLGHRKKLLHALAELSSGAGGQTSRPGLGVQPALDHASTGEAGERRQLTVVLCDMVGFTELANRVDPEVLQKVIGSYGDACAVCITRYAGYVSISRYAMTAFVPRNAQRRGDVERAQG